MASGALAIWVWTELQVERPYAHAYIAVSWLLGCPGPSGLRAVCPGTCCGGLAGYPELLDRVLAHTI